MNSVKCGTRTTFYGNFRKYGTRFYPVRSGAERCGAVQGFSNGPFELHPLESMAIILADFMCSSVQIAVLYIF